MTLQIRHLEAPSRNADVKAPEDASQRRHTAQLLLCGYLKRGFFEKRHTHVPSKNGLKSVRVCVKYYGGGVCGNYGSWSFVPNFTTKIS